MLLVVAGTRDFSDYKLLKKIILKNYSLNDLTIVSGNCRGADMLGERFAAEYGLDIKRFPAEWDKYGKYADPKRNKDMAEFADEAIVFWNGVSRGTKNMINNISVLHKPVKVMYYNR